MKKVLLALFLCLIITSLSFSEWRETTPEERAFDKKVVTEFEKILTDAARKMTQHWKYTFNPGYEGRYEIDAPDHLPHELRCSMLLDFPGESEEAQKLELEGNRYAEVTDSLAALGRRILWKIPGTEPRFMWTSW